MLWSYHTPFIHVQTWKYADMEITKISRTKTNWNCYIAVLCKASSTDGATSHRNGAATKWHSTVETPPSKLLQRPTGFWQWCKYTLYWRVWHLLSPHRVECPSIWTGVESRVGGAAICVHIPLHGWECCGAAVCLTSLHFALHAWELSSPGDCHGYTVAPPIR